MTEDKRTPHAATRRQSAKPEQVRQLAQRSQAKATTQLDRRAATEGRPILHLRYHADGERSGLDADQPSPKPS